MLAVRWTCDHSPSRFRIHFYKDNGYQCEYLVGGEKRSYRFHNSGFGLYQVFVRAEDSLRRCTRFVRSNRINWIPTLSPTATPSLTPTPGPLFPPRNVVLSIDSEKWMLELDWTCEESPPSFRIHLYKEGGYQCEHILDGSTRSHQLPISEFAVYQIFIRAETDAKSSTDFVASNRVRWLLPQDPVETPSPTALSKSLFPPEEVLLSIDAGKSLLNISWVCEMSPPHFRVHFYKNSEFQFEHFVHGDTRSHQLPISEFAVYQIFIRAEESLERCTRFVGSNRLNWLPAPRSTQTPSATPSLTPTPTLAPTGIMDTTPTPDATWTPSPTMPPLRFEQAQTLPLRSGVNGMHIGCFEHGGQPGILVSADNETGIACYRLRDGPLFESVTAPTFAGGSDDLVFLAPGIGALADKYADRVVLFQWDGSGGWRQLRELSVPFPWRILSGDFDRDDLLDVAVISREDRLLAVFSNVLFQQTKRVDCELNGEPIAAHVARLRDRDEILISIDLPARIWSCFVEPSGTVVQNILIDPTMDLEPGASAEEFTVANADKDNHPDIVVANFFNFAGVYHGDGYGSFDLLEKVKVESILCDIDASDLNSDGAVDLLLVTRAAGPAGHDEILASVQDTKGEFLPLERIVSVIDPIDLSVVELNDDQKPDLVVLEREANRIRTFLNRTETP